MAGFWANGWIVGFVNYITCTHSTVWSTAVLIGEERSLQPPRKETNFMLRSDTTCRQPMNHNEKSCFWKLLGAPFSSQSRISAGQCLSSLLTLWAIFIVRMYFGLPLLLLTYLADQKRSLPRFSRFFLVVGNERLKHIQFHNVFTFFQAFWSSTSGVAQSLSLFFTTWCFSIDGNFLVGYFQHTQLFQQFLTDACFDFNK